jgi:hypothetical protein
VKQEYKVKLNHTRFGVSVPNGYEFNGAFIPRPFWIFFHPFQYLTSSVLHKYDIAVTNYLRAVRRAARLFYNAVRLYRWIKFP